MARDNITVCLAALNPEALKVIRRSPLAEVLGEKRIFFNVQQAIGALNNPERFDI